jgi:hypothetical protein
MQASLKTPPKTTIESHPNYRVVNVSHRQGQVGMLLPHANLVVPDKASIHDFDEIIHLYEKLKFHPFNYGTSSGYRKYPDTQKTFQSPVLTDLSCRDLPLFQDI